METAFQDISSLSPLRRVSKAGGSWRRWEPVAYIRHVLRADPAPYQEKILRALFDPADKGRIAVRSPHGAGKTALAAWAVLYGMGGYVEDEIKVVTTASVWRQLTKYLWPEVHKWYRRADWSKVSERPELFEQMIKTERGQAFAVASDRADSIEGAHEKNVIFIFDEAKAIPSPIWDAAEGAFSHGNCRVLAISTPGPASGRFYEIHRRLPGFEDWQTFHISKEEALEAGRMDRSWVEARRRQWGEGSPMFQMRVEGNFPELDVDSVIPLLHLENALNAAGEEAGGPAEVIWGLDWAGGGRNETALVSLMNLSGKKLVLGVYAWHDGPNEVQGQISRLYRETVLRQPEHAPTQIVTDRHGLGIPMTDTLGANIEALAKELGREAPTVSGVGADTKVRQPLMYANVADELWGEMGRMFRDGEVDLRRVVGDDLLAGQLSARLWAAPDKDGRLKIESKDELKKRGLESPDRADALALALYGTVAAAAQVNEALLSYLRKRGHKV